MLITPYDAGMLRRFALVSLAALALVAAGCSEDEKPPPAPLPDAAGLLSDAAESAAKITSTHFVVKAEGTVPGLSVKSIDGDLAQDGKKVSAQGTATLDLMGNTAEAKFVLVDGTLYLDTGGGQYQKIPEEQAKTVYDFAAVLDPERGVAKLIESIEGGKTVAERDVGGAATFKVDGTAPKEAIVGLVPQATSDVKVSLWVTKDGHEPVQAAATFPGQPGGTLTVTLSKVNEPVTVKPPS